MSTYKTHFRKIALLADRIEIDGRSEIAHKKRRNGLNNFLHELEDFERNYRQYVNSAPVHIKKQPDGRNEIEITPEINDFRDQFLLKLETFSYMTNCKSHDVMAALRIDYEEIYTDIKHFPNIVDDRTLLDVLDDLIEETEFYLDAMLTGKRRYKTPISEYLHEASKRTPYPKSLEPDRN